MGPLRGPEADAGRAHGHLLDPRPHARPGGGRGGAHEAALRARGADGAGDARGRRPAVRGGPGGHVARGGGRHARVAGRLQRLAARRRSALAGRAQPAGRRAQHRPAHDDGGREDAPHVPADERDAGGGRRVPALRRAQLPGGAGAVGGAALPRPGRGAAPAAGAQTALRGAAHPAQRHRLLGRAVAEAGAARGLPGAGVAPLRRLRPGGRAAPIQGRHLDAHGDPGHLLRAQGRRGTTLLRGERRLVRTESVNTWLSGRRRDILP